MTITEFLQARLDEEEQAVREGDLPARSQEAWATKRPSETTRALWKINARRKILAEYSATGEDVMGRVVAALAADYSDHPGYDPAWFPATP